MILIQELSCFVREMKSYLPAEIHESEHCILEFDADVFDEARVDMRYREKSTVLVAFEAVVLNCDFADQ